MNCYVLVGGRSRRMGRPKAKLPFAGSTFLDRIAGAAEAVFERVAAVQRQGGEAADRLPTIFEPEHEDEGAVFGVLCALQDAAAPCFVIALDYPLITSEVLALLRARFEASRAPVVIPVWHGIGQTLCAGYRPVMIDLLAQGIADRRYDLRSLLGHGEIVGEDEMRAQIPGEPLLNVNTPDELEEARKIHEQQRLLSSR